MITIVIIVIDHPHHNHHHNFPKYLFHCIHSILVYHNTFLSILYFQPKTQLWISMIFIILSIICSQYDLCNCFNVHLILNLCSLFQIFSQAFVAVSLPMPCASLIINDSKETQSLELISFLFLRNTRKGQKIDIVKWYVKAKEEVRSGTLQHTFATAHLLLSFPC